MLSVRKVKQQKKIFKVKIRCKVEIVSMLLHFNHLKNSVKKIYLRKNFS